MRAATTARQSDNAMPGMRATSRHGAKRFFAGIFALAALMLASLADAQNLISVASRKVHNGMTYDLPINTTAAINGPITFETRHYGDGLKIVFTFDTDITIAGNASLFDAASNPFGSAGAAFSPSSSKEVIVSLAGISNLDDNVRVTVRLTNVNGSPQIFTVSLGFLLGDFNSSGRRTAADIAGVKARAGQAAGSGTYRYDVNTSGSVNASDIVAVKARLPVNQAPLANAGGAQVITLPAGATLAGSATDDGLPEPPSALTYNWSRLSGPGTVTFANANAAGTTASFTVAGAYVLHLSVSDSQLTGNSDVTIIVNPGAAATLTVAGFPNPQTVGVAGNITVTARDSFGNVATGYRGTVHFTSSDGAAVLPADYTFTAPDNGTHSFPVTLNTTGTRSITATDTVTGTIVGSQSGIAVNSAVLPGLFEKPNPWNKDVSVFPISNRSAAIITVLATPVLNGGLGGWGNGNVLQTDRSIAILYADNTTPRGTVSAAPGYYLPDGEATPLQMPLPLNGNTEGNPGYACDRANEDCHVLVVERTEKKLYELYNATGTASSMVALGAFVWDLTKQYTDVLRGDQCTSADAAGLPMAALIPTADEVAAGDVPHALRFILPNPRMKAGVFVRPATHAGGPSSGNPDAPPYGVRFRLKASFDETPYNASARVILRAMKKYGMILSDGGNIALTFADDKLSTAKWANLGITNQTFNTIRVTDFDVVDLGPEIVNTFDCVRAP